MKLPGREELTTASPVRGFNTVSSSKFSRIFSAALAINSSTLRSPEEQPGAQALTGKLVALGDLDLQAQSLFRP
jgi:hypothetical protein